MATCGSSPQPLFGGQSWHLEAEALSSALGQEQGSVKATGLSSHQHHWHRWTIPAPPFTPGSPPLPPQGPSTWPLHPHPLLPLASAPWVG